MRKTAKKENEIIVNDVIVAVVGENEFAPEAAPEAVDVENAPENIVDVNAGDVAPEAAPDDDDEKKSRKEFDAPVLLPFMNIPGDISEKDDDEKRRILGVIRDYNTPLLSWCKERVDAYKQKAKKAYMRSNNYVFLYAPNIDAMQKINTKISDILLDIDSKLNPADVEKMQAAINNASENYITFQLGIILRDSKADCEYITIPGNDAHTLYLQNIIAAGVDFIVLTGDTCSATRAALKGKYKLVTDEYCYNNTIDAMLYAKK